MTALPPAERTVLQTLELDSPSRPETVSSEESNSSGFSTRRMTALPPAEQTVLKTLELDSPSRPETVSSEESNSWGLVTRRFTALPFEEHSVAMLQIVSSSFPANFVMPSFTTLPSFPRREQ